jgi:predicted RNA-binding protein with PIN domain
VLLVLVVDGMNVIGARPDGWWRDRDGAVRRLVDRLNVLTGPTQRVVVVFDGLPPADLPEGAYRGVEVRFAGRPGQDAADDEIVELLQNELDEDEVTVVTSDRALQARVEVRGGGTLGAGRFLDQLDAAEAGRRPTRPRV